MALFYIMSELELPYGQRLFMKRRQQVDLFQVLYGIP